MVKKCVYCGKCYFVTDEKKCPHCGKKEAPINFDMTDIFKDIFGGGFNPKNT